MGGLILGLYYGSPLLDRLFGNKIMVYFGHTSYALYMIHNLVNIVFGQGAKMLLGDTPLTGLSAAGFMVALAVASLIAASLCFHLIENPCRQWMKRYLAKSKENSY